ncbi:MAG TPA: double-strand break repair helicase AddA [Rhizobiales bacterium]|nr:double-strand break repair helicase AddA [Hyphomicrobiales bacterium]
MRRKPDVPRETAELQALAADPANSVWVSANAGSGKTHVLSQRVIRLLLGGTDPAKILCLTYTRAAAANMANRVFRDLAGWAVMDDDRLSTEIAAIEGRAPDRSTLARARRLFAEALETPGGLKVQTIHAFCEAVLHQFPLEANIAGHFELLDGRMEAALFAEARREMIAGAGAAEKPGLADAFAVVLERGGESGLDELLGEIVRRRDELRNFIAEIGDCSDGFPLLFEGFGFGEGETAATIAAEAWPLPGFSAAEFAELVRAAEASGARTLLDGILPAAQRGFAEADPVARLRLLGEGFLKKDGTPYSVDRTFTKDLRARLPDIGDRYLAAAKVIMAATERLALFRMIEGSRAALVVADWMIARYERLKRARGFLDFNDLIVRTVNLLSRPDAGSWVQYKLDQGIDHILIDEAQDTSPRQWDVVRRLAEEFFAGRGARDGVRRTIFAVGDEKQSIYSFQGADPAAFAATGHAFAGKVEGAAQDFHRARLTWSFRSTGDVLDAVDRVFARPEVRKGLTRDDDPVEHKAIRTAEPGYVEVWPAVGAASVSEPDDWTIAIDHASAPAAQVAERIAGTIQHWLRSGERLEASGRPIKPGDVLVLVRKRDRFVHALTRSLKLRRIEVAGADRLSLSDHIAVKDMVALGRVVLQPEDDLSLAALLRSPVFGLTEEELFRLAWDRGRGISLDAALRRAGGSDPRMAAIVAELDAWATQAAFRPVFEFYAGVLAGAGGRVGVRKRMIARLGHDAGDILDEFLNFCLAQERTGLPGLEAFLSTLESASPEIRREMDQTRDEVRIMTVHAAKGLEAPVVFLVDSGGAPFSDQHLPRLIPFAPPLGGWRGPGYLWRSGSDVANEFSRGVCDALREKAEEEYRRLLYVGMTRAEDRLVVCGYHGKRAPDPMTWHGIVSHALCAAPETVERINEATGQTVHRFRTTVRPRAPEPETPAAVPAPKVPLPAVETLYEPLPPASPLPRPLAPSGASMLIDPGGPAVIAGRSPVLDAAEDRGQAVRRGIAIHRLLEALPVLPTGERAAAADRYLARVGEDWPGEERRLARDSVMAVLGDARFAPVFAEGSRAEVSVMGPLVVRGVERAVSGTIDRVAVSEHEVLIVDFKTNRPPPRDLSEVPEAYVLQLALYRALLEPIYPGRAISAALLFTEAPLLLAVPEAILDEALVRLTKA